MIDNAIRYTPNNSVITVLSGHRDGFPFVEVIDNGPGISVELRELALERFYRIPGSGGDGCGLGLAIVREVADVHGAVVQPSGSKGWVADHAGLSAGCRRDLIFEYHWDPVP